MTELKLIEEKYAEQYVICIGCNKKMKDKWKVALLRSNHIIGHIFCCSQECYEKVKGTEVMI